MAGMTATPTYDDGVDGKGERGRLRKVLIDFLTDDTAGTATITTRKIVGELVKIQTDPGSVAPTDNFDVVITDPEGIDVLAGCMNAATLLTRDTANTEETYLYLKEASATPIGIASYPVVCDPLTVSIANAGNAKTLQVILYYRV
jgi:hypothetical protein